MLSKLKVFRYAGVFVIAVMFCSVLIYPILKGKSAPTELDDAQKQMELLKAEMEQPNSSPALAEKYDRLANILSDCGPLKQIIKETGIDDPLAPAASLCINGSLAAGDPTFTRPAAMSTGNGMGPAGTCTLSASTPRYDFYSFNLTGCAVFPTVVSISLCGPAGCLHAGSLDTELILYRNVAAGDPLTANGGLPAVFNAASPCTNARGINDDSGAPATSAGGSACNQLVPADCPAPCPTTNTSTMRRTLGNGRFTVVVSGFSAGTAGNYNLYVDAPAAGCAIALAPTAAAGTISGRVSRPDGSGISKAVVTISGGSLATPVTLKTNPFGYYSLSDLETGTYVVTVQSKTYTFANPSQTVSVEDNAAEVNFVSEQ